MKPLRARFNLSEQEQVSEYSLHEFSAVTSIHGLRFIFDRNSRFIGKCIWSLWVVISFILCTILLVNVWHRWNTDPMIVTLMDRPEPVWELPFPAITICPETKSKQSVFNFTRIYNLISKVKRAELQHEPGNYSATVQSVSQVCDNHLMTQLIHGVNTADVQIYDELRKIAPTFAETVYLCKLQDEYTTCDELFQEVWTDEGLCFTFNLLNGDDITSELVEQDKYPLTKPIKGANRRRIWSLANGYERQTAIDPKAYPFEIISDGERGAFSVVLRLFKNDFDFICRGPVIGYKVSLHLPGDLPQMASHYIRIPNGQETLITIDPQVVRTAESLRSYSPNARGCYYPNEGQLKYFKEYTQRNCELECLADHTYKNCDCVKFSMPRDASTPICGFGKMQCVINSQQSIVAEKLRNATFGGVDSCNCLPACTQINYNHEISQANLHYNEMMAAFEAFRDINENATFSRLTILAKENYFRPVTRRELYSHTDLLALCGGILALFFGASLCSLLELFVYFSSYLMNWKRSTSIERCTFKDEMETEPHGLG